MTQRLSRSRLNTCSVESRINLYTHKKRCTCSGSGLRELPNTYLTLDPNNQMTALCNERRPMRFRNPNNRVSNKDIGDPGTSKNFSLAQLCGSNAARSGTQL